MPDLSFRRFINGSAHTRRLVTVPAVAGAAGVLAATSVVWAPAALAIDLARDRARLPRVRALSIATIWSALEAVGVGASAGLWALGRADDSDANYTLQRWWAQRLFDMLRTCGNLRVEVDGDHLVAPGPVVLAPRHASIADALLPMWLLAQHDMRPRYVLKRELLLDPCLDIVGNRVPNHFVVRGGETPEEEIRAVREMVVGMHHRDAAVIFPEGTTASDGRRRRALEKIAERDPGRARRLQGLTRLMPPHHSGLFAALEGAPTADLVLVDHEGFEVLDELGKVPERLPLAEPIRVAVRRIARRDVPADRETFRHWLDDQWLAMDREGLRRA